ncbi:MAG TPA: hypothetical protein VIL13_13395 [Longimicrobiales bacterium]
MPSRRTPLSRPKPDSQPTFFSVPLCESKKVEDELRKFRELEEIAQITDQTHPLYDPDAALLYALERERLRREGKLQGKD